MVRKRSRDILNVYDRKYKKTEKGKETAKRNSQKRRAKKNKTKVLENFSYKDIYINNYYVCSICGHPINPLLRYPDKHSISLDHSKPLSKGGEHSVSNCAPSHLICNIRKGAKILEPSFDGASI